MLTGRRRCSCCGCDLFYALNFFAFNDVTEVDGWTVSTKNLPSSGNYSISSKLTFRGHVPSSYLIELGLMKADNTLFAKWYYDGSLTWVPVPADYNQPGTPGYNSSEPIVLRGRTHDHDGDWVMDWNGLDIDRDIINPITFLVPLSESSTNGHMDDADDRITGSRTLFDGEIVVRPAAGLFIRDNFTITYGRGCSLPLTETELASAGSLRFAARMLNGWDGLTGTNAGTPSPTVLTSVVDYLDEPRPQSASTQSDSSTLDVDDTLIVYDPIDSPRIFLGVPFDNGLVSVPDANSFGSLTGRVESIPTGTGKSFKVSGVATTATIQPDGTFTIFPNSTTRIAIPNGLMTVEVETFAASGVYVSTQYRVFKRPNHFAVVFPEDRNADGDLLAAEPVLSAGLLTTRIDIPSSAGAGDTVTITVGGVDEEYTLLSTDITAKRLLRTYPRPADGGSITVAAVLTSKNPQIRINPVFDIDRIPGTTLGGFTITGKTTDVELAQPIVLTVGGNTVAASYTGGTSNWTASVSGPVRATLSGNVVISASVTDPQGNVGTDTRTIAIEPIAFQVAPISDHDRDGIIYSDQLTAGKLRYRIDVPESAVINDTITVESSSGMISERVITQPLIDLGYFVVEFSASGAGEDFTVTASMKYGGWGLEVTAERTLIEGIPDGGAAITAGTTVVTLAKDNARRTQLASIP